VTNLQKTHQLKMIGRKILLTKELQIELSSKEVSNLQKKSDTRTSVDDVINYSRCL